MNRALFDLDGTLLPIDSDHAFGEFMVDVGWADGADFRARNDLFYAQYQRGELDVPAYIAFSTAPWRGRPLADALAMRERFVRERITPVLHESARALVRGHQARGDLVAIVTATNEFVTRPIADALGVDALIALELERDAQGRVTGVIRGVPTYREGKVERVVQWLHGRGLSLAAFEHVAAYGDSSNDIPLLERSTDPVATNPGPALEAVARERGWRILRLFDQ